MPAPYHRPPGRRVIGSVREKRSIYNDPARDARLSLPVCPVCTVVVRAVSSFPPGTFVIIKLFANGHLSPRRSSEN